MATAVEGMELVYNPTIDTIALVTRDADFKPLLNKANEHGKETILFGVEPGFSTALRNSADYVVILDNNQMNYYEEEVAEKKRIQKASLNVHKLS